MATPKRLQVSNPLEREELIPRAAPIDSFVQPGPTRLGQLAQGLAELAPELRRLGMVQGQKEAEKQKAAGEQAAREAAESGKAFRQAQQEGLIGRHQNPWFRLGFKTHYGRASARKYALALEQQSREWIKSGALPEDFAQLESEFRQQWIAENVGEEGRDLAFEQGFGAQVDQFTHNINQAFNAAAGARMQERTLDSHATITYGHLKDAFEGGDPSQVAAIIQEETDLLVQQMGVDGTLANQKVVDAVINYARDSRNEDVLDLLDNIKGGTGPLSHTDYGSDHIAKARDEILRLRVQDDQEARFELEVQGRAIEQAISDKLAAGDWDIGAELRQLAKYNPSAASQYASAASSVRGAQIVDDPDVMADLTRRIVTVTDPSAPGYVTEQTLANALGNGVDLGGFNYLLSLMRSRGTASGPEAALKDPVFSQGTRFFSREYYNEYNSDSTDGLRLSRAWPLLVERWSLWYNQFGAEATDEEKRAALERLKVEVREAVYAGSKVPDAEVPNPWDFSERPAMPLSEFSALKAGWQTGNMNLVPDSTIRKLIGLGVTTNTLGEFIEQQDSAFARRMREAAGGDPYTDRERP